MIALVGLGRISPRGHGTRIAACMVAMLVACTTKDTQTSASTTSSERGEGSSTSSTATMPTEGTTVVLTGGSSLGEETGSAVSCEIWGEECSCGLPADCDPLDPAFDMDGCGPASRFDERGCLRRPCQADDECEEGSGCRIPGACDPNACIAGGVYCSIDVQSQVCEWGLSADCSVDEGWCVPLADLPDC
jgi:hypothetical protein